MNTTGRLIGRDQVLAVLRAAYAQAAAGQGHLVLIGGEAGIGKTAVARAAADWAAAQGALVLLGHCSETEGAPAFWPWAQVVRAAADAGARPPEAVGVLGWAGPAESAAVPGGPDGRARFRLFDATAGFLAALADARPVVVMLEDLHWADPDSLALGEFAARQLASRRVLLIGTYRDEEAADELRHLTGSAHLIPLGGLGQEDVSELMATLLSQAPGEGEARRMWERTSGNPLFVRELTRLAAIRGATGPPAPGAASVRDVIERRLARLPQDCVHLLAAASLDAPVLRPSLLRHALDGDVETHLEQAAAAGILVRAETGLRFAHDLFREVLAEGLTAGARAGLHLRLARALERQGAAGGVAHPAELAAHLCAVAVTSPDLALRSAAVRHSRAAAADAAARMAFADAVAHLERALPLLDTDAGTRVAVLVELGESRRKAGRLALARAACLDAAALARAGGDDAGLARAALGLQAVGAKTGPSAEREQIIGLLQQAAGLTGLTDDLSALVNAALARDLYHSFDASRTARARQLAGHAVALARRSGDARTLAHCLFAAHDVCWRPGSAGERLAVLDELLGLARELGDADLTVQARLLRATALLELGAPAAHAELDLFCRESERLGDAAARWDARSRQAVAALLAGRLEEAGDLIAAAGQAAEDMGNADAILIHDIQRWELARFQAGRGSYRRRRPDSAPPVETWPPWLALQAAEAGDLARAAAVMAGFPVEQSDGPGATTGYDLWFPSIAAEAAARCGTSSQRRQLYERLLPLAGTHVVCGATVAYAGAVDYYLGLLAASLGEPGAAAAHLTAAAAGHHQVGATAWARLSAQEQARLGQAKVAADTNAPSLFRRDGAVWHIAYGGKTIRMPDAKGLRDIATLLARPGEPVPAAQLAGLVAPAGADPILDDQARAAYKARLAELDQDIDDAAESNDTERAARAAAERDALIGELSHALGLGGRRRRLGDDTERARKAVTARIKHAIGRLQRYHPDLAAHLRAAIRTGTACTYQPAQPVDWNR